MKTTNQEQEITKENVFCAIAGICIAFSPIIISFIIHLFN